MEIKFKRLDGLAKKPTKAHKTDGAFDLYAVTATPIMEIINQRTRNETTIVKYWEYDTKLSIELPSGYVGLVLPRSSISETSLVLSNHVGLIDENYRGSIKFRFRDLSNGQNRYQIGDRIGQILIVPYPQIEWKETEELSESERGTDGFGSSGK
jgi:dUTP pyrophosphatase